MYDYDWFSGIVDFMATPVPLRVVNTDILDYWI
jgi:hypothetical protein